MTSSRKSEGSRAAAGRALAALGRERPAAVVRRWDGSRFEALRRREGIDPFDRGFLSGDGVFETLRAYRGLPFRAEAHLGMLLESARLTGIECAARPEVVLDEVRSIAALMAPHDSYVRVTLTRGRGRPGLTTKGAARPTLLVQARPLPVLESLAARVLPATAIVQPRRIPAACLDPRIKSTSLLSAILARRELEARGMSEGIVLSLEDEVVCGTAANVFVAFGEEWATPSLASGCRPGVTRSALLELGLAREARLTPADLERADALVFTNSIVECVPAAALGARRYDPSFNAAGRLQQALGDLVALETRPGNS